MEGFAMDKGKKPSSQLPPWAPQVGPFLIFQGNEAIDGPPVVFDASRQLGLMELPEAGHSSVIIHSLTEVHTTTEQVPFHDRVELVRAYMTALRVTVDDLLQTDE
jgi:hypothetical protein